MFGELQGNSGMTNISMLGAGFIGQMHALAIHSASMSRQGLGTAPRFLDLIELERTKPLAEEIAARFGFENTVLGDPATALTNPGLDLFLNAGPNGAHVGPTTMAANAGAHVFSEKPLASTSDEALHPLRSVRKAGVKHMCGYIHRFIPALRLARDMIQAGEIGEVRHFRS